MSWILAVETSTEWCSVALGRVTPAPDVPDLFRHERTGPRSSSRLLPAAGELLAQAGIALSDCAAIAFGAGPGSFTGLRTACGVAQGLAFGAGLPVIPVNSLLACAERARSLHPQAAVRQRPAQVLVALDARMDEVYTGLFQWDDIGAEWQAQGPMAVMPPEAVSTPGQPFWLAGNGADVHGERLAPVASADRLVTDAMPHAGAVLALARRALARGDTVDPADAAPLYLRDKVAQTVAERQAAAASRASLAAAGEHR
ncbi:tRNA (adenosine(37)-N6)-threonylcarbamoyltransferase complex dimerization subunit type 1 TsaB [Cupriavidus sp. AU9028]|uniref:tRNA (adenosine(37)-N6)-threonylcarbamoyltransferase complex dimerization subunit type 1 TsaB n=1 Tax=Cupriavidus sp. AU9028 TaxID=2871157 RepID=UPI001C963787|nr:tRNA (adenosine(37)-N6)-threonylcarbamoyltransferase complex dimerization subunit type 1 TsaB [Cupriavidus sp. AU9028]MBY4898023.1 tRNA (adenosine(37)-N6)-threonylcarbamoyltransferase complex dimerization subunit type 1 TsaB [Cupriavidus sp. AU9028]